MRYLITSILMLISLSSICICSFYKENFEDQERFEILLNGNTIDPEKKAIPKDGVISFRIKSDVENSEYKFDLIRVDWLMKRKLGKEKSLRYILLGQSQEEHKSSKTRVSKKLGHDLKEWYEIDGYRTYTKDGQIDIQYSQFSSKCLSRVIFYITKVTRKVNDVETVVDVDELGIPTKLLTDGISFYPNWITCKEPMREN